jgi:hypothetical protein
MSNKIKSVHEVYFLVRVGQWSEEDLNKWLQENIDSQYEEEEYHPEYDESDNDWDLGD